MCGGANTANGVNIFGGVVVDVRSDVNVVNDVENDVSRRKGVLVDVCNIDVNEELDVNRNGGVAIDVCSDAIVKNHVNMSRSVSFDVCSDINVENDANRRACTYANMEYNTNTTRDVMMDVRSDVNDVNVKDQVSSTANSENDGTRDVPNNAGVSATCSFKIVSLNVCGLMSKIKYPEFREMLVSNVVCLTQTKMDYLDSFDFDGFICFIKDLGIYKRKSGGGGGGGEITLLVKNRILNLVKIVEHVDFQRRIGKGLHRSYRFVDFCVFNDGLFF